MQTMAFLVLILNVMFPFSLGTFVFMCCYPNKEMKDKTHAFCHIGFTILTYIMLIVFLATFKPNNKDLPASLIIFFIFLSISYLWGLAFGGILIVKVRSIPLDLTMPFPVTTSIHHVHHYQPLPQ